MGQDTKIQWAHHTFNPWRGCTKVAPGCKFCYALELANRFPGIHGVWGENGKRVVASESKWREPLKWNRLAEKKGIRQRVFCASLADVYEDWSQEMRDRHDNILHQCPNGHMVYWDAVAANGVQCADCEKIARPLTMDHVRRRLFDLIDQTPHLDWLIVTKRPQNALRLTPQILYPLEEATWPEKKFRKNMWLLTSVACQEDAERNLPELLKCHTLAPILGVSAEPLIGPVSLLRAWGNAIRQPGVPSRALNWVIAGGESGRYARPCNVEWIRSLVQECRDVMLPMFVKQLGQNAISENGGSLSLSDKVGGTPYEWAADLRVREYPDNFWPSLI